MTITMTVSDNDIDNDDNGNDNDNDSGSDTENNHTRDDEDKAAITSHAQRTFISLHWRSNTRRLTWQHKPPGEKVP